uniref:Tr-type G domain-containing protein n=1 Tax=Tetraselmis chuii TaxID=63592 RepID=A0A7S1T5B3_9CHLO|mmetsp:Transcript_5886/g.10598  ORF Transcript_5886/g.10598 Transcript_5886/m.10598 type:complete len:565 (+) Transcript_5886:236-1930(+)
MQKCHLSNGHDSDQTEASKKAALHAATPVDVCISMPQREGQSEDEPVLEEDVLEMQLTHALEVAHSEVLGMGEIILEVGGGEHVFGPSTPLDEAALEGVVGRVKAACPSWNATATELRRYVDSGEGGAQRHRADVLVRMRPGTRQPLEVRVAVIGNVDSGKSTIVGVLTRSILDDGRGLARSKVFKHTHEESTGRTSCVGQHNLCLDENGEILNNVMFRNNNCGEYVAKSCKVVTLVDLAGHERYFRTTAYGLTGHMPDYACLVVGANAGLIGMCKEHLGVALALKVPTFFLVTKCDDICPEHVLKDTLKRLSALMKKPGVKKRPFVVHSIADALTCAKNIESANLAPIFLTSAVTGKGLDFLRCFLNLLPQRQRWAERAKEAAEFVIDETFGVPGVGTVVAGTLKRGVIKTNSTLLLGPDIGDGSFWATAVKSIHYKRMPVGQVVAGQTAALALKKVKRSQVRKGMVLVDEGVKPKASWEFDADIAILTHSTTIQPRYQAVIHCEIIRQAARVVAMDNERLRSGDRAIARFRFLQRPEFLTPGSRFVFREGRTKGIGAITAVY